jgi:hypothetical protein
MVADPYYVRQKTREAVDSLTGSTGPLRERVAQAFLPLWTLQSHGITDADLTNRLEELITLLKEGAAPSALETGLRHLTDYQVAQARSDILSWFEHAIEWSTLQGARITE